MNNILYRVIVLAWFVSLISATLSIAAPRARADVGQHDIVVQRNPDTGEAYLFNRVTRLPFIPSGNDYVRINVAANVGNTFDVGVYDPNLTDAVFQQMQGYGFNTVRLFVFPTNAGNPTGPGLSDGYVANVADAIGRAAAHGIYPILSIGGLPKTGGYHPTTVDPPEYVTDVPSRVEARSTSHRPTLNDVSGFKYATSNWAYLTQQAHDEDVRYLTDMVTGLAQHGAPLRNVLAYDLSGEIAFLQHRYPLDIHSGTTVTKTGIYDLSSTSERQRMMDDNLVAHMNGLSAAIKAVDPYALTSVQLAPGATNPDPTSYTYPSGTAIRGFAVDLITLSLYPTYDKTIGTLMGSFGVALNTIGKPLLTMEMGYLDDYLLTHPAVTFGDLASRLMQWEKDSCGYGVRGWLFYIWDNPHNETPYFNALENNALFATALAPHTTPDVCGVLTPNPAQSSRPSDAPRSVPTLSVPATRAPPPNTISPAPAPLPVHR